MSNNSINRTINNFENHKRLTSITPQAPKPMKNNFSVLPQPLDNSIAKRKSPSEAKPIEVAIGITTTTAFFLFLASLGLTCGLGGCKQGNDNEGKVNSTPPDVGPLYRPLPPKITMMQNGALVALTENYSFNETPVFNVKHTIRICCSNNGCRCKR